MSQHFADRLAASIATKSSRVVVGLDPVYDKLPEPLRREAERQALPWQEGELWAIREFCEQVIAATGDVACAFKPQVAFFERYGGRGLLVLERLLASHPGHIFILDCKRGDIGSTSQAYALSCFSSGVDGQQAPLECDAVTLNPYMGRDTLEPYLPYLKRDKGVFMLVKTSNPSSEDFQDLLVGDIPLAERVAIKVAKWGEDCLGELGYSSLGLVVGATYPEAAEVIRKLAPRSFILVPGLETQGGEISDARCFANRDGSGAIFNFSRAIIYAFSHDRQHGLADYALAARDAAERYRVALNDALSS